MEIAFPDEGRCVYGMLPLPDQLRIYVVHYDPGQNVGIGLDESDHPGLVHLTGFGQRWDFSFSGSANWGKEKNRRNPD
jgi:hypothetical protein